MPRPAGPAKQRRLSPPPRRFALAQPYFCLPSPPATSLTSARSPVQRVICTSAGVGQEGKAQQLGGKEGACVARWGLGAGGELPLPAARASCKPTGRAPRAWSQRSHGTAAAACMIWGRLRSAARHAASRSRHVQENVTRAASSAPPEVACSAFDTTDMLGSAPAIVASATTMASEQSAASAASSLRGCANEPGWSSARRTQPAAPGQSCRTACC